MAKKSKITLLLAAFIVCLTASVAFIGRNNAQAEIAWSGVSVKSYYLAGDSLDIPSRKLIIDGVEYETRAKLIRPNGTATSASSVSLDEAGRYSVQYYAVVNGVPYSDDVYFIVNERAVRYLNEETSAVYGTGKYYGSPESTGLYVNLKEQDVLELRQIINIPTVNEDIELVNYYIAPSETASADFTRITFTFTDVKDSSCYLQIVAQSSRPDTGDGKGGCYLLAGGNGQQLKGDQGGTVHVNNNYGARSDKGSFFGYKVADWNPTDGILLESVDPSTLSITLKYNPVTREIKADDVLIIDVDSKSYYGGASDVKWTGFPSGNVRLSVRCEGYNKSSAGFVLTSVKDVDLSSDGCVDNVPPEVTVITDYAAEETPYARAGENEYYPVPSAYAYDLTSGVCEVYVSVYKDYGAESQSRVNVKDGKFRTDTAGVYAIVYTAEDAFGNRSAGKAVYVTAKENIPEIEISAGEFAASYEAGGKITLPYPTVTGGSGEKTVSARVYLGDTEYAFSSADGEWAVYPEQAGAWTAEYKAVDYTGHVKTRSYTLNVTAASAPTFRESAALPQIFVAGLGNRLPELTAYDFTSGKLVTAKASVRVTDKSGTKIYKAGDVFVPAVENNGDKVRVTYFYDNGTSSVSQETVEIPAVFAYENGSLSVGNYFYKISENGFSTTVTDYGVKIVAPSGEHGWTFANSLVSNGFSLTFGGIKDACSYEKATVTLTDFADSAEKLEIVFTRSATGRITFSCGGASDDVVLNGTTVDGGGILQSVTVGFSRNRLLVNGYAYDVDEYADGRAFKGFSSGTVNLTFVMTGATENSVYYVSEVNSYTITRARQDRSAPNISITGNYGGFYSKGENYTVCPAVSADVLAPVVDFSLTVTDPDGNCVYTTDGIALDGVNPNAFYVIALNKYGVYTVTYSSVENNAPKTNPTQFVYEINVVDDEAPVCTITGEAPTKAKKGDSVVLPTYTVTDNLTAAEKITAYAIVVNPNGRRIYVTGGSFKADFAGEYQVKYYFTDEAGNTAEYSFKITVE